MTFEERLSRTLSSVLALTAFTGCAGTADSATTDATTDELAAMCDGGVAPAEGFEVREGFVEVELGADCPPQEQAELSYYGCSHTEWQGIVCGPPRKEENMVFVNDGYGGYHTSATNVPTGYGTATVSDPIDLCWYEGVFFTDPDPTYTCGRPLLHEGRPVVAPVVTRPSGWTGDAPDAAELGPTERERLAAFWLDAAVMEHASIASFARVSLDLLGLGAPPELLAATHRAAIDEVEHARLCFALASAYRGEPVAPGPLVVPPTESGASLADIALALLREGCIGETLAAVDAATRLAGARDPAVRAALEEVVRDESEHAALAWRTLRWLLRDDPSAELRARLADLVAAEAQRWTRDVVTEPVSPLERAHGLLDPAQRGEALARAWREVIAPSWEALSA